MTTPAGRDDRRRRSLCWSALRTIDDVRVLPVVLLTAATLAVSGCGATDQAATVGDETVTIGQLQTEIIDFSESFEEPIPVTGDLTTVQQEFLTRDINHLLLIELAEQEDVEINKADIDTLYDELEEQSGGDIEALRAQFFYTDAGLRRALEDELRLRQLEPIVGDIVPALAVTADEVGVEVNPRYGTWAGVSLEPGTGSISVAIR